MESTPTHVPDLDDPISELFQKKKGRSPPNNTSQALEDYITQCRSDIRKLSPKPLRMSNISKGECAALRSLRKRDDIVVKPADKGGAVVVWSRTLYIQEALRQLQSTRHYARLGDSSLKRDNRLIHSVLKSEIDSKALPKSAWLLKINTPRQPCFYMLPKIHKLNSPGRPIVSACCCPTEHISKYLDTIFQPLVTSLPSYIKDSTHALNILKDIENNGSFVPINIMSMDVSALYTNIPHADGLRALRFYLDNRSSLDPPTDTLIRLSELVLTLNSFEFDGEFFHQISGVAMGTKMGPSYACLFMGFLEGKIFESYRGPIPEFYGRFIDDCLSISSLSSRELEDFVSFCNNFHPTIKFTHEISQSALPFLDIKVLLSNGHLSTSVFYKPTDSHSYLDYRSSHPLSTRKSIPFSQFLRLRRLCSSEDDFEIQSTRMIDFFVSRHYSRDVVMVGLQRARNISRQTALSQTLKTEESRPKFILSYHPHNIPVKRIILDKWSIISEDGTVGHIFSDKPLVAYRRERNIRDTVVRSRLSSDTSIPRSPGTHACGTPGCHSCPFLDNQTTIRGIRKSFTIRRSFNCLLTNLVYVIRCNRCEVLYVGETERALNQRCGEHISDIRHNRGTSVADHFNLIGHSEYDVRVQVLWHMKSRDVVDRRAMEEHFINLFSTLIPSGLNMRH